MLRWRKFVGLKRAERMLFVQAVVLLAAVRVGVAILPFQTLRRLVQRAARPPQGRRGRGAVSAGQVAWAIDIASRCVPRAGTCLPRALAAQILLGRYGYPAQVHIGIARAANGLVEGHAWVESAGRVLLGTEVDIERFIRVAGFEGNGI